MIGPRWFRITVGIIGAGLFGVLLFLVVRAVIELLTVVIVVGMVHGILGG